MTQNKVSRPLSDSILTAMSATTSPKKQLEGVEYNPDIHRKHGKMPFNLQHLHNLSIELAESCKRECEKYRKTEDGSEAEKLAEHTIETLKNMQSAVSKIKWALVHEIIPPLEFYKSLVILNDWELAWDISDMDLGRIEEELLSFFGPGFGVLRIRI